MATAYVPKADMARATMGPDALVEALRHATAGEYEILGELGRGGMATVYLAHDISLDRKVAVKVMSPALLTGEGMVERFKREARTAGALSHPHIIPIYAVRENENLVYFVMKFVEGRPLDSIIKEVGALPIPMVQTILQQVGAALGYAHRRGVIHRDIKPANIMIDSEGWAVVTDFGIAKVTEAQGLTMTGATVGTPSYMSPEQCAAKDITGASDQYSFGIVAFEMLTGKLPFVADSIMAIMYQHFNEPPPPIEQYRSDAPPELAAAVMRMLEKEPASRWPDVDAAIAAMGATPLKHDDPIRTQMMTLAATGMSSQMLKRVSTPRSLTPRGAAKAPGKTSAGKTSAGKTGFKTAAATAAQQTGFMLSPRIVKVAVGGAVQLTASQRITGGGTLAGEEITWASTDGSVATVSDTGLVTAIAEGTAVITATCGTVSATGTITVTPAERKSKEGKKQGAGLKLVGGLVVLAGLGAGAYFLGPWNKPPATVPQSQEPSAPAGTQRESVTTPAGPAATAPETTPRQTTTAPPPPSRPAGPAANTARVNDSLVRDGRAGAAAARTRAVQAGAPAADLQPGDAMRDSAEALVRANRIPEAIARYASASALWSAAEQSARTRAATAVAPPPPPPPAAPPPAAVPQPAPTARPLIEAAIATYARAIAAKDIAAIRQIYPGLTQRQAQSWSDFFKAARSITTNYRVSEFTENGDQANVTVTGTTTYVAQDRGTQNLPVSFHAALERGASGWLIKAIN